MTNFERVTANSAALEEFLNSEYLKMIGLLQYVDFDKWCNSESPDFIFNGTDCVLKNNPGTHLLMVDETLGLFGNKTYTLINPITYQVMKAPISEVTFI